jgi:hypothetical protein
MELKKKLASTAEGALEVAGGILTKSVSANSESSGPTTLVASPSPSVTPSEAPDISDPTEGQDAGDGNDVCDPNEGTWAKDGKDV